MGTATPYSPEQHAKNSHDAKTQEPYEKQQEPQKDEQATEQTSTSTSAGKKKVTKREKQMTDATGNCIKAQITFYKYLILLFGIGASVIFTTIGISYILGR